MGTLQATNDLCISSAACLLAAVALSSTPLLLNEFPTSRSHDVLSSSVTRTPLLKCLIAAKHPHSACHPHLGAIYSETHLAAAMRPVSMGFFEQQSRNVLKFRWNPHFSPCLLALLSCIDGPTLYREICCKCECLLKKQQCNTHLHALKKHRLMWLSASSLN